MFILYKNDIPKDIKDNITLLTDDVKLVRKVRTEKDCEELLNNLDRA